MNFSGQGRGAVVPGVLLRQLQQLTQGAIRPQQKISRHRLSFRESSAGVESTGEL